MIVYVDAILCIDIIPNETINMLAHVYRINESNVEFSKMYLGVNVKKRIFQDEPGEEHNTYAIG